ncbi:MAG TPA: SDR family oxidoreductase [Acidimicrobiales bacterium]|nr:SDR family oxidoreductase [Acidimicrobiales bacterium]
MTSELAGRTVLVTGANSGIGRATAVELARMGARVHLAGRSAERTRPVLDEIDSAAGPGRAAFLPLDLGDLDSVRACAEQFLATGEPLHVLVNNAGLAGQRGLTASGFELAFGTNHVGHFLLTSLLTPQLCASAPARVVTVASVAHYQAGGIDWEAVRRPTRSLTGTPEYAVSKLANVVFSAELSRRLEGTGVTTYSVHPGAIASNIWKRVPWPVRPVMKRMFMRTPEEGTRTSVYCASDPDLVGQTGRYYDACAPRPPSRAATDELAAELWRRSAEWTKAPV